MTNLPPSPFLGTNLNLPDDQEGLRYFLNKHLASVTDVVNQKKVGLYNPLQNYSGESWYYLNPQNTRNGFQVIVYIPSLPNTDTLTLTSATTPAYPIQRIDPNFVITQVYGSASKPCSAIGEGDGDYFSFYGSGNPKISFSMSDTTIVITTTTNLSGYSCFLVFQYLRDGT